MILDNLNTVRARMEVAARRSRRDVSEIDLVAVTKKASPEAVIEILETGLVRHIGESRIQDAARKSGILRERPGVPAASWRMIGHLQTNKAAQAVRIFDSIDSLDSLRLAEALEIQLKKKNKQLPVLVQVKLSQRESQSGIAPEQIGDFIEACRRCPHLEIQGLMAIAPMVNPVEAVRPYFRQMKQLFNQFSFRYLSMGMSRDFEIAIEEGSNMVRLGTVLFGQEINSRGEGK